MIADLAQMPLDLLPQHSLEALRNHPLLCALENGEAGLSTLHELLAQHHLYSRHFTTYLCLLITRLPTLDDVRGLMHNLLEELGANHPEATSHASMFLTSMEAVGIAPGNRAPLPGTRELTAAMFAWCRSPDPLDGLAAMCLGAEAIVPFLYAPVVDAMHHLRLPFEARHFFELHITEDQDHAAAMLDIMLRMIGNDPASAKRVRDIAADMIGRRIRFLDDVWAAPSSAHEGA
jgi:pyrroloquinoline quinone (PQQ) biosynthesis protein C